MNPLRYRGYYYDNETGFYYLQSRYYDPANHRFLNADVYASTDSTDTIACNMFAYCGNIPVCYYDPTGYSLWPTTFVLDDGAGSSNRNVVVISISDEGWEESSQIMGESFALGLGNRNVRTVTVTTENFLNTWDSIDERYVIIHTHGSPCSLAGENFRVAVEDINNLPTNSNIQGILITACSTGGVNGNYSNIAQTFSRRIRQSSLVVCSTTVVSGATEYFEATNNGAWIMYRNGRFINKRFPSTISVFEIAQTIFAK